MADDTDVDDALLSLAIRELESPPSAHCGSATRLSRAEEGAVLTAGDKVKAEMGEFVEEEMALDEGLVVFVSRFSGKVGGAEVDGDIPGGKWNADGGATNALALELVALDRDRRLADIEGVREPNSVTPDDAVL